VTSNTYQVYITDQCPRIGCGVRLVEVKIGRKWVYLTSITDKVKQRISMKKWNQILNYPQTKQVEL
jgi:hypothetical protein